MRNAQIKLAMAPTPCITGGAGQKLNASDVPRADGQPSPRVETVLLDSRNGLPVGSAPTAHNAGYADLLAGGGDGWKTLDPPILEQRFVSVWSGAHDVSEMSGGIMLLFEGFSGDRNEGAA